jgi:TP901 family phage tail tape measure protein
MGQIDEMDIFYYLKVLQYRVPMDFEEAFAGVRKTINATEKEFATFRHEILEMSKQIPVTVEEIAKVAESAGQLGIQKENILQFTRTMVDMSVATNLSNEEAATTLARIANITQMPQQNFDRLGSTIVALGNNLATTEAEITEMALRIAGAGHQVGLTEPQILSFAGALSSVGIQAEAGGSSIFRVMIGMADAVQKGGGKLNQFAKVAGMSSGEFKKAFQQDASAAILTFIEGLGKMFCTFFCKTLHFYFAINNQSNHPQKGWGSSPISTRH